MEEYGGNAIQGPERIRNEDDRLRENGNIQHNEDAYMEEEFLEVTGCSSES